VNDEPAQRRLKIVALSNDHARSVFSCGVDALDRYLKTQAGQDVRRRANGVFILVLEEEPKTILGYYTLAATALPPGDVPDAARRHLPRYPLVSATLLGRLAVVVGHQGSGLGAILLADALRRAYLSAGTVGSSMVVVDAMDERAARFYAAHGFLRLPDSFRLVMPMRVIERVVMTS
jgi:GNAT superfamily N-acetyltransferase